ncbi:hypothetical protein MRX96_022987 [Rhipicephalus microplus]
MAREFGVANAEEVSPIQDGAPTVLSVNLMPTSPKDLRISAVVGDQVHISFSVNTGATASLMTKKGYDIYFASKHRMLQTSSQLQNFSKHRIPVLRYFRTDLQHSRKRTFVTYYVTAQGTSLLGLDAIQQLGLLIDGTTLTCRLISPVSSEVPAGVPPGLEHLFDGQLELVQDFAHWIKRWQNIVPRSSLNTPFLVSRLSSPALHLLSPSATPSHLTCPPLVPVTQDPSSGLQEGSPGCSSPSVDAPNSNIGPEDAGNGSSESEVAKCLQYSCRRPVHVHVVH